MSAHAVSIRVNSRLKTYKIRRDPMAWQGPFVDFVVRYGIQKLAKQLDVRLCTVYQWINGQWSPTRDKAKQIARIALESGVILTSDDVLDHHALLADDFCPARDFRFDVRRKFLGRRDHRFKHLWRHEALLKRRVTQNFPRTIFADSVLIEQGATIMPSVRNEPLEMAAPMSR